MIIWAMALTALLGFLAVALAAGDYVQSNGNSQNAADAAALFAATVIGTSGGSQSAAEQAATTEAESLAKGYGQVPAQQADWQKCGQDIPSGFSPAFPSTDPNYTNCIAFGPVTSTQTLVSDASPTVTISAPSQASGGESIAQDAVNATLEGVSGSGPQGTIYFFNYQAGGSNSPPSACVTDNGILPGGWSLVGSEQVNGGNTTISMPSTYSLPSGYFWWEAYYDGTGTNNLSASSGCTAEQTIVSGSPILGLSAPAAGTAGVAIGQSGSVVAQVSATTSVSGDTITFYEAGPLTNAPGCVQNGGTGWSQVGNPVAVTGNGTYAPSQGYTPDNAGQYWWDAVLQDGGTIVADGSCGAPVGTTVNLSTPRLSLSAPAVAAVGDSLPLSGQGGPDVVAALTGTTGPTTGDAITFYESGPSTTAPACYTSSNGPSTWVPVGTANVTADGVYSPNAAFAPTQPGDYWWDAVLGLSPSDTTNGSADSSCSAPVKTVIGPSPTTPTLSLSVPNTAVVGDTIDPHAVVADIAGLSNAGGTITFYRADASSPAGSCPPPGGGNGWLPLGSVPVSVHSTYTLEQAGGGPFTVTQPGQLSWYAAYSGSANNSAAGTGCGIVTWVEVPGQSLPTILGTGVNEAGSTSYAVFSQASGTGKAKLCYYPGNCATA